jgi:hypothetical protein
MTTKESFADTLRFFEGCFELHAVFDDFLTLIMCPLLRNADGTVGDFPRYHSIMQRYAVDDLFKLFNRMYIALYLETVARKSSVQGSDVLGECYEDLIGREVLMPSWGACMEIASTIAETVPIVAGQPVEIVLRETYSGRLLLALARRFGKRPVYFGIESAAIFQKMTLVNLLMHHVHYGEVLHFNPADANAFVQSCRLTPLPPRFECINAKEQSKAWQHFEKHEKLQAMKSSFQPTKSEKQ